MTNKKSNRERDNLPGYSDAEIASDYINLCNDYFTCFKNLGGFEKKEHCQRPIYNLLFQAVELLLKANLLCEDYGYENLRNKTSHDLKELIKKSNDDAIKNDAEFEKIINWLNDIGSNFDLRYPKGRDLTFVYGEKMFSIIERLYHIIHNKYIVYYLDNFGTK